MRDWLVDGVKSLFFLTGAIVAADRLGGRQWCAGKCLTTSTLKHTLSVLKNCIYMCVYICISYVYENIIIHYIVEKDFAMI